MATSTMLAARMQAETRELRLEEVPVPLPRPHEVRVRVRACGICLSDVHLLDGSLGTPTRTVTLGHEAAGEVDLAGTEVQGWEAGQRVVVAAGRACGGCRNCLRSRADACLEGEILGIHYDGAWAEYVVVPAAALAAVPDTVPFEHAAIIADAVSTPYAALLERAALRPAESVGLWGIGGLGVHAVQIARVVGAAPIIAVDPSVRARARARAVGADLALDPGRDVIGHGRLDLGASVSEILPLRDVHRGVRALETKDADPVRLVLAP